MLTPRRARAAGFTIVELMITVAVIGIVMLIGLPSLSTWIQNTQVRTAAEATISGLQLARTEALRRNRTVQFTLVNSVGAGCAYATTGTGISWVVSLLDPAGNCNLAPSDAPGDPAMIVQKRNGSEGSPNAVLTATGGSTLVFNGLARVVGAGITQIDISSTGGACQGPGGVGGGPIRCLQVNISSSGQTRMCDPAVNAPDDPRNCAGSTL